MNIQDSSRLKNKSFVTFSYIFPLFRLKLLDWFDHCSLQIGDRLFYRIKNDDKPLTIEPKKAFNPNDPMTNKAQISINYDTASDEAKNKEVNGVSLAMKIFDKNELDCNKPFCFQFM